MVSGAPFTTWGCTMDKHRQLEVILVATGFTIFWYNLQIKVVFFPFRINNRTGWQNLSETFYLTRLLHCPFNASPATEFIAHPITFSPTSSNTGPCQYSGEPAQQHFTWMWQTTPFKFFAFSYKIVVWQQETTLKCQHTFIASTGELKLREQQVAIQQKRNTTIPPSTTNNGHLLRPTANDGLFQSWFQIAIQIFYPFRKIGFQFHTRQKKKK